MGRDLRDTSTKIKYVLHAGYVISKNDGGEHFISGVQLARLYGVKLGECIDAAAIAGSMLHGKVHQFTHLYPDPTGKYELPKEQHGKRSIS